MCVAVPMRVVELIDELEGGIGFGSALVETGGARKEVYLHLLDGEVAVGDYLIVHAGFAINRLDEEEALRNLELLRSLSTNADCSTDDGPPGSDS